MDWNHQGIWAVGAAVAGGLLGVLGTNISTSSSERLADIPFAVKLREAELRLEELAAALSAIRGELQAQSKAVSGLSAGDGDPAALTELSDRIDGLAARLAAAEQEAKADGPAPDPEAVARILMEEHADSLRGPPGAPGANGEPGPAGEPGPKGEAGGAALGEAEIARIVEAAAARAAAIISSAPGSSGDGGTGAQAEPASPGLVGALDCLELDGQPTPVVRDFVQGGAVCLAGGQVFAIAGAQGCLATLEDAKGLRVYLKSGQQGQFDADGKVVSVAMQCDPSVKTEEGRFIYRLRLSLN